MKIIQIISFSDAYNNPGVLALTDTGELYQGSWAQMEGEESFRWDGRLPKIPKNLRDYPAFDEKRAEAYDDEMYKQKYCPGYAERKR